MTIIVPSEFSARVASDHVEPPRRQHNPPRENRPEGAVDTADTMRIEGRSLILSVVVMAPSARSCVTQGAMLPEIQTGISWTGARSREMRLGRPPRRGCRGLLWHVIRPRQQDSLRGASDDGPGHPTHGPGTGGGMGAFSMVPAPGEPRQPMLERINPSTWPQASGSYSAAAASPSGTGQLRWSQA